MDHKALLILCIFSISIYVGKGEEFIYKEPDDSFKVPLHELCSFNVLEWKDLEKSDFQSVPCKVRAIDFQWQNYIPEACVPRSIEKVNKRVFVSTPRRMGVPSALSVFHTDEIVLGKCPKLTSYPSFEVNQLVPKKNYGDYSNQIVNVQVFSVDQCTTEKKLWLFDTGVVDTKDGLLKLKEPSLVIISLETDKIVRQSPLPRKFYTDKYFLGFSNVVVNIVSNCCDDAYAYIVNHLEATLTVYSYKENLYWQFSTTLFAYNAYPDSLFEVQTLKNTTVKYQVDAGIYDVSVDKNKQLLIFGARSRYDLSCKILFLF